MLFLLYTVLAEKFVPFLQAFQGETITVPSLDDLREAVMVADITNSLLPFRVNYSRIVRDNTERAKVLFRLERTYNLDAAMIRSIFLETVKKFELQVLCQCGERSVPGKRFCRGCLDRHRKERQRLGWSRITE